MLCQATNANLLSHIALTLIAAIPLAFLVLAVRPSLNYGHDTQYEFAVNIINYDSAVGQTARC